MRLAPAAPDDVSGALAALRAEVGLPAMFPQDVLEEARAAAEKDVSAGRTDRRDIEFVTIDPPGSKDLDQAVHVEPSGEGYVVHYAIADLGAFVTPGGALDEEVRRRGMTVYGPDAPTPLHPKALSEGAASLLPEEDRPAVLWTVTLDARGVITDAAVERALVHSRERLTYAEAQSGLDAGTASESLQLLADVGRLRQSLEAERGGVSLEVPEQEVEQREDGTFALSFRRNLPVEGWNAQISLLTGIVAATIMRQGGVGILRTLPEADPRDLARLRRTARALRIEWPDDLPYARLVPTLESRIPEHAAFLNEATTLFRGAGYVAFGMPGPDGVVVPQPENTRHAAIAADYAHVTAPLRRLADRYATEICLAIQAGTAVPAWVLQAMLALPAVMVETGRRASSFQRECVDIVEASLLADSLGEEFDGVVVDVDEPAKEVQRGQIVLREPAVRARVVGPRLPLGDEVRVKLTEADVSERRVMFKLLGGHTVDPAAGRPDTPELAGPRSSAAHRSTADAGAGAAAPGPFAVPADGVAHAHGTVVLPRQAPGPESAEPPEPAPQPQPSPSPGPRPTPRPRPTPQPQPGPQPQPQPSPLPGPQRRPGAEAALGDLTRPAHGASNLPVSRPVRPQVKDEIPLSEPWPRPAPGTGSQSQPVPAVEAGALPDVVQVPRYPAVSSLELPVVAPADMLAVEGPASRAYRY
ncbi:hypothetical protein GCM10017772_14970 [Promicromonospora soli]|uniref:RNB domain-containing protein n=2 Tax=Promicromonospora soli TaxID=2035533 RepID=A0A919FNU7_9MICO|nr:hypothetical protein GCM10017772_14970 [Promicromonospora soli]